MDELFPEFLQPYQGLIVGAATALLIFVVGWIASKWVHALCLRAARRGGMDEALARFLSSMAQYAVLAFAVIAALSKVGVQTTSLVALLGAAGLAVGLALQGNLGHFASGVMLLLFRPFTLEDKVRVAGENGQVKNVGLFASTLTTPSNEEIIVPNGSITSDVIINYTSQKRLRAGIAIGIAYGSDVNRAMAVMIEACKSVDSVLGDPAPSVNFSGFGASSLDFEVRPWATTDDYLGMLHDVRIALYDALNAAEIEIPFDQIVVHRAD
ncbi:MAG: mechanosensitive ion channel [Acidobacteriota bacterium]|nr:mechanosensitive ion channel [Acidobacteriota bacterium]